MTEKTTFTLDGREVEAGPDETIWQVAEREGVEIPHLCWLPEPGYRADGPVWSRSRANGRLPHPVSASPRPAWWSTPPMNVRKPREKW